MSTISSLPPPNPDELHQVRRAIWERQIEWGQRILARCAYGELDSLEPDLKRSFDADIDVMVEIFWSARSAVRDEVRLTEQMASGAWDRPRVKSVRGPDWERLAGVDPFTREAFLGDARALVRVLEKFLLRRAIAVLTGSLQDRSGSTGLALALLTELAADEPH